MRRERSCRPWLELVVTAEVRSVREAPREKCAVAEPRPLEAVLPALLNLALAASERIFLAFPTAAETGHGSPQVDASRRTRVHIVCFGTRVPKLTV